MSVMSMFKLVQLGPLYTCSNLFILNCGQVAFDLNAFLLPPATKLGQRNIFRSVCQEFCWGGHEWWGGVHDRRGACMAGGMPGGGVSGGGYVLQGACMAGGHAWHGRGMHGRGCVHGRGDVCVVVGACMAGGMHGRYYMIWSMSERYTSYLNAFLLNLCRVLLILSL